MKIFNVRAGFATNSSSSHSVILLPKGLSPPRNRGRINSYYDKDTDEHKCQAEFGWDDFVLSDQESKMIYFAGQLNYGLHSIIPDLETRAAFIQNITGLEMDKFIGPDWNNVPSIDIDIDHNSSWGLNLEDTSARTVEILKDFKRYLDRNDIVIYGGNDNDGYMDHPNGSVTAPGMELMSGGKVKKDDIYYTIVNKYNGSKVRFSLDDNAPEYVKASTPDLVDLRITQFCNAGCAFCYMSSTKEGKHASLKDIKKYVDYLYDLNVLEVALGGGEPTEHPDFLDIIRYVKSKGMICNFTTYSAKWLRDEEFVKEVAENVSAIGVSVHSFKNMNLVNKITEKVDEASRRMWPTTRVVAQHVLGSVSSSETCDILKKCWTDGMHILLLGYKSVGFGKNVEPHDVTDVLLELKLSATEGFHRRASYSMLSVDTAFVDKFKSTLEDMGVAGELVSSPEGKFSMYIDAVEGKMAKSSYVEPSEMTNVPDDVDDIKKIWMTY